MCAAIIDVDILEKFRAIKTHLLKKEHIYFYSKWRNFKHDIAKHNDCIWISI